LSLRYNDFRIIVKTDNAGTSGTNQFTIPTSGTGYNYNVETSDGYTAIGLTGNHTITFPSGVGTHTVIITGTFPRIFFNNGGDKLKVLEIVNFGTVGWTSMSGALYGCANCVININANADFSSVTVYGSAFRNIASNSFPLINMSGGTGFGNTWRLGSLTSFPAIDMPNTTTVESTWESNNLDTFPAINLQNATNVQRTWRDNGVMSSFATRNFYKMTNGATCFLSTTLPTEDWSDILITQEANNINDNVTFHGGSSTYNVAGGIARALLVARGWIITDGGAE
jgi:hypothetical protein